MCGRLKKEPFENDESHSASPLALFWFLIAFDVLEVLNLQYEFKRYKVFMWTGRNDSKMLHVDAISYENDNASVWARSKCILYT